MDDVISLSAIITAYILPHPNDRTDHNLIVAVRPYLVRRSVKFTLILIEDIG